MKRPWIALIIAGTLAVISQPAAAERVLRLTLQLPITNVLGQNVSAFKRIVERESGGEIRIEIYPAAELYKDKEVPQAVSSGAVDMGVAPITRFSQLKPAVNLFNLPFLFTRNEDIAAATAPGHPIRATLDREILATGARPLWWQPFGLAIMLGKDAAPLHPDRIQGKKTRVFGSTMQEFIAAVGGEALLISGSKQYEAYARGDVEFGMTGITAVKSRKLYEVMGRLVTTNHAALEFVVVIHDALWQELSDAHRAILEAAAVEVEQDLRRAYLQVHQKTLDWISVYTTMMVSDLTAEELAAWRAAVEPVYDSYLQSAGPIGADLLSEARKFQ